MPTVILAPLRCSQSASGPSLDIRLTVPQFKSNPKILFTLDLARLASLASRSGQRAALQYKRGRPAGDRRPLYTEMRRLSLTRLQAGRAFAGALQTSQFVWRFLERVTLKLGTFPCRKSFPRQTGPACKASLSPPGWLAPSDIGKTKTPRRGFCFLPNFLVGRRSARLTSATMTGISSCKSRIRRNTMICFHYGLTGIAVAAGLCIVSASQPARATLHGDGLRLPTVSQEVIAVDDARIVVGDNHKNYELEQRKRLQQGLEQERQLEGITTATGTATIRKLEQGELRQQELEQGREQALDQLQ